MNALFRHPSSRPAAQDHAELDALREMVPQPGAPRLSPTRHAELEAHLMNEVNDTATTPSTVKPLKSRSAAGRPSGFGRLTPGRSMSLGVAAAVVAATVAGFAVTGSNGQTAVAAPAPLKVESSRA
ncbi:hypothetical protein G3I76_57880, partial [Streptomyces sp. SID11233]|nr:hypothetical protein [Streptomyces sp. SID11233]